MNWSAGSRREEEAIDIAGCRIDCLSRLQVVDRVFASLADGRGGQVITANVDHLHRFSRSEETRRLFGEADLVVADGVPLLWAARLAGAPLPGRVAGSDLVWDLAERAAQERRSLYLLGGNAGAAEAAAAAFQRRWPELRVAGCSTPRLSTHPSSVELEGLRRRLKEAQPDLVYVALGAPKQERVASSLRRTLPGIWWVGVGISLSFVAGELDRAPPWIQRLGLEWLHRLRQEPGRLMRRYLIDDLPFCVRMLTSAARRRLSS